MCIAGPYVLGAFNTAGCPAQTYYIGSEGECRAAGAALNLTWGSALSMATVPRWCSAMTTAVYFNSHPVGAAVISAKPLCLTVGTPSPTNLGDTNPPTTTPTAGRRPRPHAPSTPGRSDALH
jgi:hypothetical protein